MQNQIRWLVRIGLDQNLFTRAHALAVKAALGTEVELMDFAQKLIDDGHVADEQLDSLERVLDLAFTKGKDGPPADDPFATTVAAAAPGPTLSLRKTTPPPATAAPAPADAPPASGPASLPVLAWEQLGSMDAPALAAALNKLLRDCARYGASDLHLSAGMVPFMRRNRALVTLGQHRLTAEEALRLNLALLTPEQRALYQEIRDFDYALALDASNRYRVNLMFHKGGASGSYRMVPARIPRLEELGLRNLDDVKKLLNYHNGLILVTGPVGSGKTTTLAALVAELNASRQDHIITVEDPIEVVQPAQQCNLTQREVGAHTASFASALKGALREDPDVIVIGELRDLETIEMAITASETGHLVIGTMHTSDAATTLNRLLDVFPPAQQAQIRASVAESLRGILCQRLLPTTDGGLVLAGELLVANSAVIALIRDGKTQGLRNVLETGKREGMYLMENVVFELWEQGKITAETARKNISTRMLQAKIT
ncbi:MAG: PilT/PilU family type 4a pilus ATPase [Opitutus sp.]|nr:PilT/PilU family type 4a pilus ATPase [Opitutus sp.]MCS6246438.1 PilT/PilU family type 4a pilus ATPase [Opitutus sp.]MCS6273681.1 PilT/PilU family type 4a pilus ATPase [Opitutus sp.]MCS6277928.1 PilT/PilU family type 4a pilus ATPase [Opitutus sp.]MCS6298965.1 PilT/PilU family type 4a pilus ATPase [Opitutus sp.]